MKALASPPVILLIVVAVARYMVPLVSFFRVSTQNCFCLAWGRLFTVNNLPQVKCNLYHPYSRCVEKHAGVYVKY